MKYKTIHANKILNKITKKDDLFKGEYTIDPYKNCEFACKYCDSSFDDTIFVKTNTVDILEKELKNNKAGRIIIGSVHDAYQEIEKKYKITQEILKIIKKYGYTAHILTKSDLVLRDIALIKNIKDSIVTISVISLDKKIYNLFENNLPSPKKRFEIIKKLRKNSIFSGIAIMPVLPYLVEEELERLIKKSKEYNSNYVLFKHLELKGDQKQIFLKIIKDFFPGIYKDYKSLYESSFMPNEKYILNLNEKVSRIFKQVNISNEIKI